MLIQGSSLELRFNDLKSLPVTAYGTMGVLNSQALRTTLMNIIKVKGGSFGTSFFTGSISENPRIIGIPFLVQHQAGGITWALGTLESQMITTIKDQQLLAIETQNAPGSANITAAKADLDARLAKLTSIAGGLRNYFDSAVGWDQNYFYALCDKTVGATLTSLSPAAVQKSALVNILYSRLASDLNLPLDQIRPYLVDSPISDWIDTADVYRFPRNTAVIGALASVSPTLKEWAITMFSTGSRKTARELVDRVAVRLAQRYGIPEVAAGVDDAKCSAIRAVVANSIEMTVTGYDAGRHPLSYGAMSIQASGTGTIVAASAASTLTFRRTRDTLAEHWDALPGALTSLTYSGMDAWERSLDRGLSAFWQLSWGGLSNPRVQSIEQYTPGNTLQCQYVWHLVGRMGARGLQEYSNGIA